LLNSNSRNSLRENPYKVILVPYLKPDGAVLSTEYTYDFSTFRRKGAARSSVVNLCNIVQGALTAGIPNAC